jgi:hypothetical protein
MTDPEAPSARRVITRSSIPRRGNNDNTDYGFDFVHSIVLSHEVITHLEAFMEYVGISPSQLGQSYQAFFDTGVSYQLTENLALDCAVDIGLSKSAPDYTVVAGITIRI